MKKAQIVEQGVFSDASDIIRLKIIDWSRLNGYWEDNPSIALGIADNWLRQKAGYTVLSAPLRAYPDRDDWPGWKHVGHHEPLGRLFWNCFFATHQGTLVFADEPDFTGTFVRPGQESLAHFAGDIGVVSASTFLFTLLKMQLGDLWISVPDEETQVIIEPLIDYNEVFGRGIEEEFGF